MRNILFLLAILLLSACSSLPEWAGGDKKDETLKGERISVLVHRSKLTADSAQDKIIVQVPTAVINTSWHLQHIGPVANPAIAEKTNNAVTISMGSKAEEGLQITSTPIIADNTIYTIDGQGVIEARNINNLDKILWGVGLHTPDVKSSDFFDFDLFSGSSDKDFLGGNLSYSSGMLFITTGRGAVVALDAKTGLKKWQRSVKIPVKSAPVANAEMVFLITSDNRLYALDIETGKTRWTHSGLTETTSVSGAPSVAINKDTIIVPYSSGELYALDIKTGVVLWNDLLISSSRRDDSGVSLNDIDATPVIADNMVYTISHDGVLTAFSIERGNKAWSQEVSGLKTPWVAGDFLYLITIDNELACIHRSDGLIKWVKELPSNADPLIKWNDEKKGAAIIWNGPVMAGGNLLVTGSHGKMLTISAHDGNILTSTEIIKNVILPPVVANKTIYVISNDARLMAFH